MDVNAWLAGLELSQYADQFTKNDIDGVTLLELNNDDLKELGVVSLGHRKRLLAAIEELRRDAAGSTVPADGGPAYRAEAERRQLTVMFIDLVGSSSLSSKLDPEELRDVITAYQNIVAGAITRFDGNVAKYMGDGVLCYFGWPRAHEDDAERALRAGLAVTDVVSRLKAPTGEPLAARTGIATGLVIVGDLVGKEAAQEQAVVGETPNLAARLQELAEPNSVVISGSTRRLLGEVFELQELEPQTIKGFAQPAVVYRAIRERPIESRFEARHGRTTLELVGRHEELSLLLRRWKHACHGEGQVVIISGEAGIGKSRLLRAVGDAIEGQPHYRINYQGSPYHTDSALRPAIEQLTRAAGLVANDSDQVKLDKLEALMKLAGDASMTSVPLIAALLNIEGELRYGKLGLTPQQQRTRTLQALIAQLIGLAENQPVLFVFEDAHWFDPTTLELIDLSLEAVRQAKVMMLLTARSSFEHQFGGHSIVTRLVLNRLSRESCMGIISRLTRGDALPDNLREAIVKKTDGVPLFVEELTKTVLETERQRENDCDHLLDTQLPPSAIPSTLRDSLMARLDRLSAAKEVAQTGACIGREFEYALLSAVSQLGEADLIAALTRLTDSELVYRHGEPPEATYLFKHALVRDVAHESLLRASRTKVHARIAECLKTLYPEQAKYQPEVLAHHYGEAGLTAEAIRHWIAAAKLATERSAHVEALAQLNSARLLLDSLPHDLEHARYGLDIQALRAAALLATRGYIVSETIDAFEQARALCRKLNEPPEVYQVLRGLCSIETMKGNLPAALSLAQECLEFAEAQNDSAPLCLGHRLAGQCRFLMGEFQQARAHVERAIDAYEPERHRTSAATYGLDLRTGAAQILGLDLCLLGYPNQALRVSTDVVEDARQLGSVFSLAVALEWAYPLYVFRGEYGLAYENAEELLRLATDHELEEYVAIATTNRSLSLALRGLTDRDTLAQLKSHIASYQDKYGEFFAPYTLGLFASAIGAANQPDQALVVIDNALLRTQCSGQRWNDAELHRLKGELLLVDNAKNQPADHAEESFERALAIARLQQAKWLELRTAKSLARLWTSQDQEMKARELLAPIYSWFTEGFETGDLKDCQSLLDVSV